MWSELPALRTLPMFSNFLVTSTTRSTSKYHLIKNQFFAMTMKKGLSHLRSWMSLLIHILIPVIFIILAMMQGRQQNASGELPALPLTLVKFTNPVTVIENNENTWKYSDVYKKMFGSGVKETTNITELMINLTKTVPSKVRKEYIMGATFEATDNTNSTPGITAWFNNGPFHTAGITLAMALNAMYKNVMHCDNCGIEYTNHPLPYNASTKADKLIHGMGFHLANNLAMAMPFVSGFFILFVVKERACNSKHLQFVSGVNAVVFWCTAFLWDMATYLVIAIAMVLTILCFQEDGFKTADDIGRLFFILFYFGCAMLPLMYVTGCLFTVPSTAYMRMTIIFIFIGVTLVTTTSLDLGGSATSTAHVVFLIFPHYSLVTGIRDTYTLYHYNQMCSKFYDACRQNNASATNEDCLNKTPNMKVYCQGADENYYKFKTPGIGKNILASFLVGAILFLLLLIGECMSFSSLLTTGKKPKTDMEDEDNDVAAEKTKIRNTPQRELMDNYIFGVKDLTKYYHKHLAVNGLCLAVKRNECFGLLGVNGAGKTTTFKMMTGDETISYGDGWVDHYSIKNEKRKVQKEIGYCPQFDALLDDLTARETVIIFALIRGISYKDGKLMAESLAKEFDFSKHLDKKVRQLSGGNKRKLSTSLALIGNPAIMYLDEPTTGMDPATKRYLWNALCKKRDSGTCIILTSHSMEECQALCTRLAIMVNGNFKCLGSPQHLKNKFSEGYTLTIKVKKNRQRSREGGLASVEVDPPEIAAIERYVKKNFPGAKLREKHQELVTFYITDKSMPCSRMFGIMEAAKKGNLDIEDYSLGQCTLEQVFLIFAKQQK